jgi:hypothetical protein
LFLLVVVVVVLLLLKKKMMIMIVMMLGVMEGFEKLIPQLNQLDEWMYEWKNEQTT